MRTLKVVLPALLLLLTACATAPGRIEEVDTGRARALYEQGEFRAAAYEYESLAGANRRTRDALLLAAAEALREEGDFDAIRELSPRIRRDRLSPSQQVRFDLLAAEAALDAGDGERALSLATMPDAGLDAGARLRAREIRARALAAS
ncbi:MAG TPA: penicillin-binding protein activator, partial [Xanthomonadales bacterium]|nr:penicillin-binding protein activator [Xanthomonadales bacterium]